MRRMRRRTHAANAAQTTHDGRLFCGTNGCASFLEVNPEAGTATCHICGFVRRVH